MALKPALARIAHRLEGRVEKYQRGPAADNPVIDCYGGYTTPDRIILRGRVLAKATHISGTDPQSRWRNFRDFVGLFATDELQGIEITHSETNTSTLTDEEGFFALALPYDPANVPTEVTVQASGASDTHIAPVFSAIGAPFGVISDIDDTMLRTGAFSLARNLWTSATDNVHQREVFADAVALMTHFAMQGAAFFYVSSSPWNLYDYLQSIFARTKLPLGPFFLRDLGISEQQFITGTHGDHKTDAIEKILVANPTLEFILVGDTGQHDSHIYADIVSRYPDRIRKVVFRRPSDHALPPKIEYDLVRIEMADVPVKIDFDYRKLLDELIEK